MRHNLADSLHLVAVTDDAVLRGRDPVAACLAAERGGATMIQLRLKEVGAAELAAIARSLLAVLRVPLIINDRVDVAIAVGAAGVHLGPDDLAPAACRAVTPPGFLIGASVGLEREIASGAAADYWGIGPFRVTGTKREAGDPLGLAGIAAIVARSGARPCVAIGGVRPGDQDPLREAGVVGVAVVSGIFAADPEAGARRYAASRG